MEKGRMNHIKAKLLVKKIRLVCAVCGRFVIHDAPLRIIEAEERKSWEGGPPRCKDHPAGALKVDVSASELTVEQGDKGGAETDLRLLF